VEREDLCALVSGTVGDDPIAIDAEQSPMAGGTGYPPGLVQSERYVRAMVQVLLLELGNRHARAHTAEIPTWLTEGLSRQLSHPIKGRLF